MSIKTVLMGMPRGFLQDFCYICIAKAKDFAAQQVRIIEYLLFRLLSTHFLCENKRLTGSVPSDFHLESYTSGKDDTGLFLSIKTVLCIWDISI